MGCDQMTDAQRAAMQQEPVAIAVKGAIMGAAYAFRDAHLSGSNNLIRSAHAALDMAVDAALQPAHQEPYGYLYEGIASHTRDKTLFKKTPETHLETRWWREVGPVYTAPQLEAKVPEPTEVKLNGVVYEPGAATYMCNGCAARYDIGLCADLTEKFPCNDVIWQPKEIKEPVMVELREMLERRAHDSYSCGLLAKAAIELIDSQTRSIPLLTDGEILNIARQAGIDGYEERIDFAQAIEQAVRQKAGISWHQII